MIQSLGADLNSAVEVTAKKMALADSLLAGLRDVRLASALTEISLIDGTVVDHVKIKGGGDLVCANCHTLDNISTNGQTVQEAFVRMDHFAAELRAMVSDTAERDALRRLEAGVATWRPLYDKYLKFARERDFAAAHDVMLGEIYPCVAEVEKAGAAVRASEDEALQAAREAARKDVGSSLWRVAGSVGISLIVGVIVLLVIRRVTVVLRATSKEIAGMSTQLASATDHIASASESLAQTATEQSASLEITCASSEEIRSTVGREPGRTTVGIGHDEERERAGRDCRAGCWRRRWPPCSRSMGRRSRSPESRKWWTISPSKPTFCR